MPNGQPILQHRHCLEGYRQPYRMHVPCNTGSRGNQSGIQRPQNRVCTWQGMYRTQLSPQVVEVQCKGYWRYTIGACSKFTRSSHGNYVFRHHYINHLCSLVVNYLGRACISTKLDHEPRRIHHASIIGTICGVPLAALE